MIVVQASAGEARPHALYDHDLLPAPAVGEPSDQGPVDIFELHNLGYLAQYLAVGFLYGGLPATLYGVFNAYLNVPGYVYAATVALVNLPWSFKVAFGIVHDLVPVGGYCRKPYMSIGWATCALPLLFLSTKGLPPPYWCRDAIGVYVMTCDETTRSHSACAAPATAVGGAHTVARPCNADAQAHGIQLALMLCLATAGVVCADGAHAPEPAPSGPHHRALPPYRSREDVAPLPQRRPRWQREGALTGGANRAPRASWQSQRMVSPSPMPIASPCTSVDAPSRLHVRQAFAPLESLSLEPHLQRLSLEPISSA